MIEVPGDEVQLAGGLDFSDFTQIYFSLETFSWTQRARKMSSHHSRKPCHDLQFQINILRCKLQTVSIFSNLLTHAMRDTAASSFVLPWETDEWSCIFDPDSDIMDALLPSFEPKLKAVKLTHVAEEQPGTCDSVIKTHAGLGRPLFQVAVSHRHDMLWTERKEAELQRALEKWHAIVCNWPDSWACKRELLLVKVKQAEPLTVSDVRHLHYVLEHGDVWDKVFSGGALLCIYSRARWSDFIHGSSLRLATQTDGLIIYAGTEV